MHPDAIAQRAILRRALVRSFCLSRSHSMGMSWMERGSKNVDGWVKEASERVESVGNDIHTLPKLATQLLK